MKKGFSRILFVDILRRYKIYCACRLREKFIAVMKKRVFILYYFSNVQLGARNSIKSINMHVVRSWQAM